MRECMEGEYGRSMRKEYMRGVYECSFLEDCMRECMRRVYEESLCEECVRLERTV